MKFGDLPATLVVAPYPNRSNLRLFSASSARNAHIQAIIDRAVGNFIPKMAPYIDELIAELAPKRPRWKFYGLWDYAGQATVSKAYVVADDECIGWIGVEHQWSTGEYLYAYDSPSLNASRSRNHCTKTTKLKRAVSEIISNMQARDHKQIAVQMISAAAEAKGDVFRKKVYPFNSSLTAVQNKVGKAVLEAWGGLRSDLLTKAGIGSSLLEEIDGMVAQMDEHATMTSEVEHAANGTLVYIIRPGTYLVGDTKEVIKPDTPFQFKECDTNTVPEFVRTGVGMLKLTDVGSYIMGYGYRLSDNKFYLFKQV
jgi:hypothetical protein